MPSPILYPVAVKTRLSCTDPLHVNNFYNKQRVHWQKLQDRQQLVLYLANLHAAATSTGMPLGMVEITLPLSKLRKWIHDYRVVLDHFFEVRQLGYHLENDEFEFSKLIPKKLSSQTAVAASRAAANLEYEVPKRPDNCTISKVYVQQQNAEAIREYIKAKNRLDLLAPTEWLLKHPEINFHFVRAGRLQLRDTSVWPIAGIENWPSKLRELLFGPGLDTDAAYTQFLVKTLQEVHAKSPELLKMLYPDLLKAIHDKQQWRADLCQKVLRLPLTDENIGLIKRICMSLANGSRISPGILLNGVAFSVERLKSGSASTQLHDSTIKRAKRPVCTCRGSIQLART